MYLKENKKTLKIIRESLEEKEGKLFWKDDRPLNHFNTKRGYNTWKSSRSGREAGWKTVGGYRAVTVTCRGQAKCFLVHRVIWALYYGKWPKDILDHKDGDRGNNRIVNLTVTTDLENTKNNSRRKDNKTKITGICWDSQSQMWLVQGKSQDNLLKRRTHCFFEACCYRKAWEHKFNFTLRHGTVRKEEAEE